MAHIRAVEICYRGAARIVGKFLTDRQTIFVVTNTFVEWSVFVAADFAKVVETSSACLDFGDLVGYAADAVGPILRIGVAVGIANGVAHGRFGPFIAVLAAGAIAVLRTVLGGVVAVLAEAEGFRLVFEVVELLALAELAGLGLGTAVRVLVRHDVLEHLAVVGLIVPVILLIVKHSMVPHGHRYRTYPVPFVLIVLVVLLHWITFKYDTRCALAGEFRVDCHGQHVFVCVFINRNLFLALSHDPPSSAEGVHVEV